MFRGGCKGNTCIPKMQPLLLFLKYLTITGSINDVLFYLLQEAVNK